MITAKIRPAMRAYSSAAIPRSSRRTRAKCVAMGCSRPQEEAEPIRYALPVRRVAGAKPDGVIHRLFDQPRDVPPRPVRFRLRAAREIPIAASSAALSAGVARQQRSAEVCERRLQLRPQKRRCADDRTEHQTRDESVLQGRDAPIVTENITNELKH